MSIEILRATLPTDNKSLLRALASILRMSGSLCAIYLVKNEKLYTSIIWFISFV